MLLLTNRAVDTKESEIERLFSVHSDPAAAAEARSRLLAPEQQLQQRQLRKSFMRVEKALNETESKATALKALIAQRDRFKLKPKIRPPTADATRVVVLKLTGMAEKKNREVEHLEERLRRLKLGHSNRMSRSVSGTPGRYGSPSRFDTPERSILETPARRIGGVNGSFIASTPVMLLVEDGDVSEIAEENRRRREAGKKLKGALQKRGGRFTVGETVG